MRQLLIQLLTIVTFNRVPVILMTGHEWNDDLRSLFGAVVIFGAAADDDSVESF